MDAIFRLFDQVWAVVTLVAMLSVSMLVVWRRRGKRSSARPGAAIDLGGAVAKNKQLIARLREAD